jgi:hypothetical protein
MAFNVTIPPRDLIELPSHYRIWHLVSCHWHINLLPIERELMSEGYNISPHQCPVCERYIYSKVTRTPWSWESDVMHITFYYFCVTCNYGWTEHDSD